MLPENAEKSIASDELIAPEAEGVDTKEEISEAVEPPSKCIRSRRTLDMISSPTTQKEIHKLFKK